MIGCNYAPTYASNQIEMWAAEIYDPDAIARELADAASLGFNTLRVYLHDLVYAAGADAFLERIDDFLTLAARHGLGVIPVIIRQRVDQFLACEASPASQACTTPAGAKSSIATLRSAARFSELEGYGARPHSGLPRRISAHPMWRRQRRRRPVRRTVAQRPSQPASAARTATGLDGRCGDFRQDPTALARQLQSALKRVRCYDGVISGVWTPRTRAAMKAFTDRVNGTLPVDKPDHMLLASCKGIKALLAPKPVLAKAAAKPEPPEVDAAPQPLPAIVPPNRRRRAQAPVAAAVHRSAE